MARKHRDKALIERFVSRAHDELRTITVEDLLSFLKVRRVAPGSSHAAFTETFGAQPAGRKAFCDELVRHATDESHIAPLVEVDLMGLVNDLRDRSPGVGRRLKQIALHEFDAYARDDGQWPDDMVRSLMIAAARFDEPARRRLAKRYRTTDEAYAAQYDALLTALGREPIPEVGDAYGLALIIASVLDGFLTRAIIEGRHHARVRDLFEASVIPLLGALTYPQGSLPPSDENRLYFDLVPGATAPYLRTSSDARPLTEHDEFHGTWQGTVHATVAPVDELVTKDPVEAYLVIDGSGERLRVTMYTATGRLRMLFPQITTVSGRSRLACMYEAELEHNPTPERPSHRGGWILETETPVDQLVGTFFTDTSARGQFAFSRRVPMVATSYPDAREQWDAWEPKDIRLTHSEQTASRTSTPSP